MNPIGVIERDDHKKNAALVDKWMRISGRVLRK